LKCSPECQPTTDTKENNLDRVLKILAELDYAEKPPKPYTKQELKEMFAAIDDEEKLLYGLFLNSGVRDAEMQNTEYADLNWEKSRCTFSRRRGASSGSRARVRRNVLKEFRQDRWRGTVHTVASKVAW